MTPDLELVGDQKKTFRESGDIKINIVAMRPQ